MSGPATRSARASPGADPPVRTPRQALAAQRGLLAGVVVFGVFVNLLAFTGPLFALQVYDRVLGSRSLETLATLSVLMVFLFVVMGVLDYTRRRLAARIGERFVQVLERPVFTAGLAAPGLPDRGGGLRDLDGLRQFFASAIFIAILDLPWLPVFLAAMTLFHPALGILGLIGATVFVVPGLLALAIRPPASDLGQQAQGWAEDALADHERAQLSGGLAGAIANWRGSRRRWREEVLRHADRQAVLSGFAQSFRMFLQSAVVALAAWLVLRDQLTAGAIIAATVLLARALAPLDAITQNAPLIRSQLAAWRRVSRLLAREPAVGAKTAAPIQGGLSLDGVTVFAHGSRRASLRMVSLEVCEGQFIGVIGPSGAGKTTLLRTIAGLCPVAGGQVLLGGVPVTRISAAGRARYIGYLPQRVRFTTGTIAQNIGHFDPGVDPADISRAALAAGVHDRILSLPDGYETALDGPSPDLPGGMIQQIALARALFGDPALLLLDEPANNMDAPAIEALNEAVFAATRAGRSVVMASQRPAALAGCDMVLVLGDGVVRSFTPGSEIARLAGERARAPARARPGAGS